MTSELKPPFPDDPPFIDVPIRFYLALDFERFSSGSMLMRLNDTTINLQNAETGEQVGTMGMALGGSLFVSIGSGLEYRCAPKNLMDVYSRVKAAHEKSVEDEASIKQLLETEPCPTSNQKQKPEPSADA
jgi:hypothetical protein